MAVIEVKAKGKADAKEAEALTSFIASAVGRYEVKTISGADLTALLGFEKQKQLVGCADTSCLAEVGGALGVEYLLASEVGQVGDRWLMTLTLLDARKATALQRASHTAANSGGLIDGVGALVEATVGSVMVKKAVETTSVKPATSAATAIVAVEAGRTQRTTGYALVGSGAALLVAGAISGTLAFTEHSAARDAGPPVSQEAYDATKSSIELKMVVADALYAVGAVAAAVGLVVALTAPSSDAPPTRVSLAPIVGGGGAVIILGGF
ncbi:MAG: hypothetical protein QM765_40235 [Myxococcales bacterium]